MKRIITMLLCLMMALSLLSAAAEEATVSQSKPKIVVLATGGTIAGVGEEGKTAGYKPGSLTAEELLSAVPQLSGGH